MKMSPRIALCLHDVRVSGREESVSMIESVIKRFQAPLTLHLVFDDKFDNKNPVYPYIKEKIKRGDMELVFHGINHMALKKVKRYIAFYHKYEAEYIVDSEELSAATRDTYNYVSDDTGSRMGICPSCWLATPANKKLFRSLEPPYIESLFHLDSGRQRIFSPVISLASPLKRDLFFLRLFARLMYATASLTGKSRVRVAVHPCDIGIDQSIGLLADLFMKLREKGYSAVLQRNLID